MKILVEIDNDEITKTFVLSNTLDGEKYRNEIIKNVMEIAEFDFDTEKDEFLEANDYIIDDLIFDSIANYNDVTLQIIEVSS